MVKENVPGDFLLPVPVGAEAEIRYDMDGAIERVYFRKASGDVEDVTDLVLEGIKRRKLVPIHIGLKGGTTWVSGVIYTGTTYRTSGKLPDCLKDSIIRDLNNGGEMSFFAASVHSKATNFTMAAPAMSWLKLNRFNVLNGRLYFPGASSRFYLDLMHSGPNTIRGPIQSVIAYTRNGIQHKNLGLVQKEVIRHRQLTDDDGTIKIEVDFLDNESQKFHYAILAGKRLGRGTVLTLNQGGSVADIDSVGGQDTTIPKTFVCPKCGANITSKDSLPTKCTYKFCESRLIPRVSQFIRELSLPTIELDDLKQMIAEKQLTTLLDILDYYAERGVKIQTTIPRLMSAIISYDEVHKRDTITKFVNRCNNSEQSLMFYLQSPDRLYSLMDRTRSADELASWALCPENILELNSFLNDPNVEIAKVDRKFDGAPIFRNNTIMITGQFCRGSLTEIASILSSYSATVVTEFSENVQCVVVGDTQADIDGVAISAAKQKNIPVIHESEFFVAYDIDHDLSNLV